MIDRLQAPFTYFGGKSAVAPLVWRLLGDVKSYIEPFFGSGAVLLARPNYDPTIHNEIINDRDGFVANVWRSLQFSPDETARWCDWPVNHADLTARKAALLKNEGRLLEGLVADDTWHDPVMAGYWIWAASCWIGTGLTSPNGIPRLSCVAGVHKLSQRPQLTFGMGVHKMSSIPKLTSGTGVHKMSQIPPAEDPEQDVQAPYNPNIYKWFRRLSERLRHVRVVCGDWTRVCGGNWQAGKGVVGIFFDPPYSSEKRDDRIYHCESMTVAQDVQRWALARGGDPDYRIIIAGYEGEHEALEAAGWRVKRWKARGGYSNLAGKEQTENRKLERLWISPHCRKDELF